MRLKNTQYSKSQASDRPPSKDKAMSRKQTLAGQKAETAFGNELSVKNMHGGLEMVEGEDSKSIDEVGDKHSEMCTSMAATEMTEVIGTEAGNQFIQEEASGDMRVSFNAQTTPVKEDKRKESKADQDEMATSSIIKPYSEVDPKVVGTLD